MLVRIPTSHTIAEVSSGNLAALTLGAVHTSAACTSWRLLFTTQPHTHVPFFARWHASDLRCSLLASLQVLHEETKGDAVITTGVGQHQMWAAQYYKFDRPRQWATSGGLGSMGFGLPSALGAAIAFDGTDGGRPKKVRSIAGRLVLDLI